MINRACVFWLVFGTVALVMACNSKTRDGNSGVRPTGTAEDTGSDAISGTESNLSGDDSSPNSTVPKDTSNDEGTATNDTLVDSQSQTVDTDGDLDNDGWPDGPSLDCDDSDSTIYPGAEEDTTNGKDDDCDGKTDEVSAPDTDSSTDEICEEVGFSIEKVPPRMMLLLDFSASMNDYIDSDAPSPQEKWEVAETALKDLVTTWGDSIDFGVDVFPDRNGPITNLNKYGCYVDGPVKLDVTMDGGAAALNFIDKGDPNGASTPLYCAMKMFEDSSYAPVFLDPVASRYLVVVSDGADLCGTGCSILGAANATQLGNATKALLALGIKTYVIGFGGAVEPDQLDAIAQNGGTGYTTYFDAADPASLSDALTTIAVAAVSCVYGLDSSSDLSDPNKVNLYFEGEPTALPRNDDCDNGVGWRWTDPSHTAIEFCSDSCTLLQDGTVSNVRATFGCATVVG